MAGCEKENEDPMVAALVLITGVAMVLIVGAVYLIAQHKADILPSVVPLAPWLVAFGCVLLILTELLLLFGRKEDRRIAVRDLCYLVPTLIISAGLGYLAKRLFW
jgi:hypothetical protein